VCINCPRAGNCAAARRMIRNRAAKHLRGSTSGYHDVRSQTWFAGRLRERHGFLWPFNRVLNGFANERILQAVSSSKQEPLVFISFARYYDMGTAAFVDAQRNPPLPRSCKRIRCALAPLSSSMSSRTGDGKKGQIRRYCTCVRCKMKKSSSVTSARLAS